MLIAYSFKPVLFAVGSLLEHVNKYCIVWGTGMAQPMTKIKPGKVIMTRGLLSQQIVKNMGGQILCKETGDPALLLPLIYNPNVEKCFDITIIPHRVHYERILSDVKKTNKKVNVIDLTVRNNQDIEAIVKNIKQSRIVFSSSLHGLIVAHAYGIPAIWIYFEELTGGDFKFKDYFSSVGIAVYEPLKWNELLDENFNLNAINQQFMQVDKDRIIAIQKALMDSFPCK